MSTKAYTPVWEQAMDEWGDGPRTMSSTAAWANRWFHELRTDHERLMITLAARDAELADLRGELADLVRYKNEKSALVRDLGLPEKACWGEVLTVIASLRLRYREAVKALARLVRAVDDLDAEDGGPRNLFVSPGCVICTSGTTPDHRNTGLCAYHEAQAALKEGQS